MKKANWVLVAMVVMALTFFGTHQVVDSHCEIPCGIYGDTTRIDLLFEDIATVEKSMTEIANLMKVDPPGVLEANQVVRWIGNKEEHANKIQHTVTQYFMTQRVKPPQVESDAEAQKKYVKQLTALHKMLIAAMQGKQTVDVTHTKTLRKLLLEFSEAYFSAEDLKHIREHHGK